MFRVLVTVCIVSAGIWLAVLYYTVPSANYGVLPAREVPLATAVNHDVGEWRRTVNGWEKFPTKTTKPDTLPVATRVHPGLVASMQILLSIGSLLAFSSRSRS